MLHSCDAGDKSVITVYPGGFNNADPKDGYSDANAWPGINLMRWYQFNLSMPIHGGKFIDYRDDMIERPFESHSYSANFCFSHGHLITNAGYDKNYDFVFNWEEPYQSYLTWKAGYRMYAPNKTVVWHLWDRSYRPLVSDNTQTIAKSYNMKKKADTNSKYDYGDSRGQSMQIRRIIYGDKEYRHYLDEKWGLDLLG